MIGSGPDQVWIKVIEIRTRQSLSVRLGITAPPHVPVHRREVYDKIKEGDS